VSTDRFDSFRTLLVRIECPLPTLVERERSRGDRKEGLASEQLGRIHASYAYDLSVDTSVLSPDLCAQTIGRAMMGAR
jgi:chloramphenicol 3-O phosphotransferase